MSFGDCRDFFDFGLHVGVDAGLRMAIKAVQQTLDTAGEARQLGKPATVCHRRFSEADPSAR
jgi:hypothetical protein